MPDRENYHLNDRDEKLGRPPWTDKAKIRAWEYAHGHDARLKCLPEFGCVLSYVDLTRLDDVTHARVLAALSPAEPVQEGELGRDMEPLAERPGYNAKPTNWVRYANHLERELAEREDTDKPVQATDSVRAERVYHVDGPLGQIRQMADWAHREAIVTEPPNRETLRKIAANLRAAVVALAAEQEPKPGVTAGFSCPNGHGDGIWEWGPGSRSFRCQCCGVLVDPHTGATLPAARTGGQKP